MPFVRPWRVVVVVGVAWATACSSGSSVPVSEGTVMLDGRPLADVVVDLVPAVEADAPINGAVADDAGRFRLRSRGSGRYTAVITARDPRESGGRRVPARYSNPDTSPLEVVLPLEAPLVLMLERE
jgi:hypothetical protein